MRRITGIIVIVLSAVAGLTAIATTGAGAATVDLVAAGARWAYNDTGTPLPADGAWAYADTSGWKTGVGEFGYGDGDETTVVGYGPNPNSKYPTTYFATSFTVSDPSAVTALELHLLRDDGAVTYLNGTEINRSNVAPGKVDWWTFAQTWDTPEDVFFPFAVDRSLLRAGTNILASSVHQAFRSSPDVSFHARLSATVSASPTTTTTTTTTTVPGGDPTPTEFFPAGSTWMYNDTGTPLPANGAWSTADTSAWTSGAGELGYGDGDEATEVGYGPNPNDKYPTTYFIRSFTVDDAAAVASLELRLLRDDGAVAYLNGVEVARSNVAAGKVDWWTFAQTWDTPENVFFPFVVDPGLLRTGTNKLAVSIHQAFRSSPDISFDASLTGTIAAQPSPGETLFAVGDIADCTRTEDEAVASLLSASTAPLALLGDLVYPDGSATQYADCFLPAWGEMRPRIRATPGNHDYRQTGAGPYYDTFAGTPTGPAPGYYTWQLGAWTIVVLNTNCGYTGVGNCDPGGPQYTWLQSVLANPPPCLLAYGHHPFRSSTGASAATKHVPLLQLLDAAGLDIYLAGHAHNYERFAPMNGAGTADASGFRSWVVGTGGIITYPFDTPFAPNSEVRATSVWGALELTLRDADYSWDYRPALPTSFSDSGSGTCHG